jgi:hypothetical protein
VRHPTAEAAQIDTPLACSNIIVDSPHPMQAPDRKANRRTKDQPRAPSLSARHISPDTPPIKDSAITSQIGISANACCSVVMYDLNQRAARGAEKRKPRRGGQGFQCAGVCQGEVHSTCSGSA